MALAGKNIGSPNGPSKTAPFSRWFRYPAGFAADLVDSLIGSLPDRNCSVVDPFLGAATLAPPLWKAGHSLSGVEANPLIAEIARLKLSEPWPTSKQLTDSANETIATALSMTNIDLDDEHDVVRRCFTDDVLRTLVSLRCAIAGVGESQPWLRVALGATLRDVSRSSVGWPYQRPDRRSKARHGDAAGRFRQRVEDIAEDLDLARPERRPGLVVAGDARRPPDLRAALADEAADACITSPPYLNNYDYADATRLELYFFGLADSWSTMCRYARDDMIVATTQQSSRDGVKAVRDGLAELPIEEQLQDILAQLGKEMGTRSRPKEYDRLVPQYLADISTVLTNLAATLKPGAPVVIVIADSSLYGVHVPTHKLVAELAAAAGLGHESTTRWRHRGTRWANNTSRSPAVSLGEYVISLTATGTSGKTLSADSSASAA